MLDLVIDAGDDSNLVGAKVESGLHWDDRTPTIRPGIQVVKIARSRMEKRYLLEAGKRRSSTGSQNRPYCAEAKGDSG